MNFRTNKETLAVFDFDNTLYYSPENTEENVALAKEKYGTEFIGWWGRRESLDMEIFDIQYIDYTRKEYLKHIENGAATILLTGRPKKLSAEVTNIYEADGFKFDDAFLCNGAKTDIFKVGVMKSIVEDNKSIKTIYFYDDRDSHITAFRELRSYFENIAIDFIFIRVKNGTGFIDKK